MSGDKPRARPRLTITEAAHAAGVHRNTIRRAVDAGRFPGAEQVEESGQKVWRIPVEDLLAADFTLHSAGGGGGVGEGLATIHALNDGVELDPAMFEEIEALRRQLNAATRDLEVQRALAVERDRTINILTEQLTATRELLPGPIPPPAPVVPARRSWWRRKI